MNLIINEDDAIIVRSSINLAHDLGLIVVAEDVESQEIYELIGILGCDDTQGYHMSHAMPSNKIASWVAESKWA